MNVKENVRDISNGSFPWKYFIIVFTYSWIIGFIGILISKGVISTPLPPLLFFLIGSFGPFISSFYLTYRKEGKLGVRNLWKRALNFKIPLKWLSFIFLLPVCVAGISFYLKILSGGEKPELQLTNPIKIAVTFIFLFFLGGSFAEEFGWRGYALDRLQQKWNALVSSLILGFIWGLWHLPLFFAEGISQSYIPFWAFFVWIVSASILFTFLYNNTNRNILAALLFHTMGNLSFTLFPVIEMKHNGNQRGFVYCVILYLIISVIVVLKWGYKKLSLKATK